MESILFNVFVFLAAACLVVPLASRFKLGSVLGYMLAGVLIGPYGLGLIGDPEKILHFAEFGVVMMLFVIGLELEPALLWRMRKSIVGLGGLQVAFTTLAFTAVGVALGHDWRVSLAVGMALSLSSTALVLQILQEKNLLRTPAGENAFSVLLFQDIAVIPILVLMPLLATRAGSAAVEASGSPVARLPGWAQTLVVAAAIVAVIFVGRYLSPHLFRLIAKTRLREVFTAISLALVVGITLLMQWVGISPALGAFLAGVVLANSEYRRTLETDIEPFKGLLLGLFFISIGMGMDFDLVAAQPWRLLGAVSLVMAVKALLLAGLGRMFGLNRLQNAGFALALCQGGEFAFVLFQFAGGLRILAPEQAKFLTMVVAVTMACTPVLMYFYSSRLVPRFMSLLPERDYDEIHEKSAVILAGFGRFGQVIGRFLGGSGVPVTVLESDPDQIDLLRKFGYKAYFGDASRLDILRAAGAEQAKLLIVAVDDPEVGLGIVRLAKEEFPRLQVFARARNRRHAYELHKLGVADFRRETFDSALGLAQEILIHLGRNEPEVRRKAEQFQRHDEASLRKSFEFFDSEPELVNFARLSREELDRLLQADAQEVEGAKS